MGDKNPSMPEKDFADIDFAKLKIIALYQNFRSCFIFRSDDPDIVLEIYPQNSLLDASEMRKRL